MQRNSLSSATIVSQINNIDIVLYKGDITFVEEIAIANAANSSLLGGGGVDGAIHYRAGKQLKQECWEIFKKEKGCKPGHAKITSGGNLPAQYVIHTVGPVWHNGVRNEDIVLGNCYKNSIIVAEKNKISGLIFPSISTGIFGYPVEKAAEVSKIAVSSALENSKFLKRVGWCLFDRVTYMAYEKAWSTK
ncbi:macro domain-containing protein [Candidatus Uabimicrobium sp. HlEnr_7]|uniref:macro domain-containing protein n=1 Tax=Candidatus Uabimicrobium helgolandensis TaxID=3095367 RepID=UPI003556B6D0